jgi:hypothetical protein
MFRNYSLGPPFTTFPLQLCIMTTSSAVPVTTSSAVPLTTSSAVPVTTSSAVPVTSDLPPAVVE